VAFTAGNLAGALREIIKQLADVKERVAVNTALLHEVIRRQKHGDKVKRCSKPECVQLPLKTYDNILEMERQLKSDETFKQMVCNQHV
jgi:hypothetical protein